MRKFLIVVFSLGLFLSLSTVMYASTIDVKEFATGYFLDPDESASSSPYYRYYDEDWGWTHGAIAEAITTVSLSISAYDVDFTEIDRISGWDVDTSTWIDLGQLTELGTNVWSYTTFDLTGITALHDEVAEGLQIWMDIDSTNTSITWAVTLAKSVLNVNEGILPDPDPNPVPEPTTMLLFGLGILGLAGVSRRKGASY